MPLIVICIGVVESASYFWRLIRRATSLVLPAVWLDPGSTLAHTPQSQDFRTVGPSDSLTCPSTLPRLAIRTIQQTKWCRMGRIPSGGYLRRIPSIAALSRPRRGRGRHRQVRLGRHSAGGGAGAARHRQPTTMVVERSNSSRTSRNTHTNSRRTTNRHRPSRRRPPVHVQVQPRRVGQGRSRKMSSPVMTAAAAAMGRQQCSLEISRMPEMRC